jgi:hypothetical protein
MEAFAPVAVMLKERERWRVPGERFRFLTRTAGTTQLS